MSSVGFCQDECTQTDISQFIKFLEEKHDKENVAHLTNEMKQTHLVSGFVCLLFWTNIRCSAHQTQIKRFGGVCVFIL